MIPGAAKNEGGEVTRRRAVPSSFAVDFHNSTFTREYVNAADDDGTTLISMPVMGEKEKKIIDNARLRKEQKKGAIVFFFLLLLALGLPSYIIYRDTPFFYLQNVRCRLTDRFLHKDGYAAASEEAYKAFFDSPPLFGSEEYRRAMWWGTYDPSKIFALTTAPLLPSFSSSKPEGTETAWSEKDAVEKESTEPQSTPKRVTVGIAWYDDAGMFPLRHTTALLHNRVISLPSKKVGNNPDALRVEWVVHDGHHYGRLRVEDYPLRLRLEIEFLKTSPYGDGWHARFHGTLEPTSAKTTLQTGVHLVIYLLNDDESEEVSVNPPDSSSFFRGARSFHPTVGTQMWNYQGKKEPISLHIFDDHSPLGKVHPWRIMLLHSDGSDSNDSQNSPFAFQMEDTFGGRASERLMSQGKTRSLLNLSADEIYSRTPLNLRALSCPSSSSFPHSAPVPLSFSVFCVTDGEESSSFHLPSALHEGDAWEKITRNMVVLKRLYTADFRLDLSLSPSGTSSPSTSSKEGRITHPLHGEDTIQNDHVLPYRSLSVCQATNAFRRREKLIAEHHYKMFRPWTNLEDENNKEKQSSQTEGNLPKVGAANRRLWERIAGVTLAELLGSLGYSQGHYWVHQKKGMEENDDSAAVPPSLTSAVSKASSSVSTVVAPYTAAAFSFVGSRTDEPFSRLDISGLHNILLVRYNKELAKSVLYSWLVQSQDPRTGFIPSRTGFNAYARSLMPREFRVEEEDAGLPPTLLVGLQELLRELKRKRARIAKNRQQKRRSTEKTRNTDAYLEKETEEDLAFLRRLLPSLRRWRAWWHRTQCGGVTDELARRCENKQATPDEPSHGSHTPEDVSQAFRSRRPLEEWPARPTGNPADQLAYRWRSRAGPFSLPSSGLEDYPRPVCPGEEHRELHVDLFSWVAYLSRLISEIEVDFLGLEESVKVDWEAHLNTLHWDETQHRYSDRIGCVGSGQGAAAAPPFSEYVGVVNVIPVALGIPRRTLSHVISTMELVRHNLSSSHSMAMQSLSFRSIRLMREKKLEHKNVFTGPIWPQYNLLYVYTLKTVYGALPDSGSPGEYSSFSSSRLSPLGSSHGDNPSINGEPTSSEKSETLKNERSGAIEAVLRRTVLQEYHRLRGALLPPLLHASRWWECFSPIDGSGLGGKTYIGSRGLLLGLLFNFE